MLVLVTENASERLRGELTKWLLEVKTGIFVGKASAVVREKLWDKVDKDTTLTGALMIYNADTEQGFKMELIKDPKRTVVDLDGLQLVKIQ